MALFILPLLLSVCIILYINRQRIILVGALSILMLTMFSLLPPINGWIEARMVEKRWQSISTLPLTYSVDSKYQNIAVSSMYNQYNLYLNTMFASVFPNDEDNMLLAAHLVCQHPQPKRILVIGDAMTGLAKFLLQYHMDLVVSVEIDDKAIETILKFLPEADQKILEDKRFNVVIRDGREYVKDFIRSSQSFHQTNPGFDLVYLNVSEPSTLLLNRYYTREFFIDLARVLNADGVIVLKVTSSENYEQGYVTDYTASVFHTVQSVFPEVAVAPGVKNFFFASRSQGIVTDNPQVLAERWQQSGIEPAKLARIFYSLYPEEKTLFIRNALENHRQSKIQINTDDAPIACLYFNKIIGWYGESNLSGILGFFEGVQMRDVIFMILFVFLWRLLYIGGGRWTKRHIQFKRFHTLLAVFSAGMTGLSLELVILYTFQGNFGDIYHIIGFIIAVFMFGLPLGALFANRLITRHGSRESFIISHIVAVQILLGIISWQLPGLMSRMVSDVLLHQVIIFIQTILIGFAVGMVFPLAIHLYLGSAGKTGKTAGIIDAFDHIGAAVGAFFIGTLFLPVIGVHKVCHLIALFPLISAFLLFTDIQRLRKQTQTPRSI